MRFDYMQRAWLRGALVAGAALGGKKTVDGREMDGVTAAFVRLACKLRGNGVRGLEEMRKFYEDGPAITGLRPDRSVRAEVLTVGGRPARRYHPETEPIADMLYFHGGGFIMGSLNTHDALCRLLAARAGLRIVAIDYRLAPEHPFPAAYEDACAAWTWARAQDSLPWVIAGDSAGGNLAAGQALDGIARLQVLIYPAVDLLHEHGRYPSIDAFQEGYILSAQMMQQCVDLFVPEGQDAADPRVSPIRADMSRASPALVVAAGFDPLYDQAVAYAAKLQKAGVRTHLIEEGGLPHGFADMAGVVPEARRAVERLADAIKAELTT